MIFRRRLFTALFCLIIAGATPFATLAQDAELAPPATLLDALDLPICADYLLPAHTDADSGVTVASDITPEGAETRSVMVFSFDGLQTPDLTTLMLFESKDDVAEKAAAMVLTALDDVNSGDAELSADAALYGWMVLYYDVEGTALCRSTGYPAVAGDDQPLEVISLQGFIAQMVTQNQLDLSRYQPNEFCSFDTPQFCEAIFIGDDADEAIEGTAGVDLISGAAGNDTINGNAGGDYIEGGDGDDVISGGDGGDVIIGGSGGDVIRGGDGDDVIMGGDGNDDIRGDAGVDSLDGEVGIDTVRQD